jgi:hypothetical protein
LKPANIRRAARTSSSVIGFARDRVPDGRRRATSRFVQSGQ